MTSRFTVVGVMLAFGATFAGCGREEPVEKVQTTAEPAPVAPADEILQRSPQAEAPRDPELPRRLRALHEAADRAISAEERAHAADELLEMFRKTGKDTSPHLISVRQDLAARASHLLLESSPERAKAAAERGLGLSPSPSVLRANLFIALADAEEALGDQAAAKRALLQALAINEELFESEMKSP